jgi:hypothetical protein
LQDRFEINLFNTFRSYIDPKGKFPVLLKKSTDGRGSFVEILKTGQGGQVSYSTTLPGITRGARPPSELLRPARTCGLAHLAYMPSRPRIGGGLKMKYLA